MDTVTVAISQMRDGERQLPVSKERSGGMFPRAPLYSLRELLCQGQELP